jgi:flagellar hook-length control protein FliK
VESAPFDALLGACVQGNAVPVKTFVQAEQVLSMLGGGDPPPHLQEAALEGTSREIATLPGGQRGAGNSWTGLLGTDAAPGWKDQASQDVEAGSPRSEGGSTARHRIVPETNSLNSNKLQDESTEGAFPSKEIGASKGETQEAGLRATLSRMEALKGMEQAGEQQGGELKSAGHAGQGETAGSLAGKEGASWKQEVQVDLPTRPAPPPVTSNQAPPAHVAQAGSGGTFRFLGNDVHMRIQDEELGPMRWHIHLRGGRITAEAIVETSRVQELLQNHRDGLEAKLNAVGVDVEEFDVSVDEGSQRFAAFSDPDGSRQTRRSTEDPPHVLSMEPVVLKLRGNQDREVDLYV